MSDIKLLFKDASFFRKFYIITLFLCQISFLQIFTYVALAFLFIWGIYITYRNTIKLRGFLRLRHGLWILGFIGCGLGTSLIYISSNFILNLVMLFHVSICFFVFYGMHTEKKENHKKELFSLAKFIIITTTFAGILGLLFLFLGVSFEFLWIKFAIYDNRFTGVYSNPNLLGFSAVVALFCCHMMMKKRFAEDAETQRMSRIWLCACVMINLITLFLCDSRGAFLLLVCYLAVSMVFVIMEQTQGLVSKKIIQKVIAISIAGVIITVSFFFVSYLCQTGFSAIMSAKFSNEGEAIISETGEIQIVTTPTFTHESDQTLDNGRLDLLKNSATLFLKYPLIGIGRGNIIEFGQTYLEDTRLGYNLNFYDFHNGYMTILVSTGILGFAIFTIFGLRFAREIFSIAFKLFYKIKDTEFCCLIAFVCAYLVYALLEKTLLYDLSILVMFFWAVLGYLSTYLNIYKKEDTLQALIIQKRLNAR